MHIERFRPVLYFENDVKDTSVDLLVFTGQKLGYDLYWHAAPMFEATNFFGNPVNHWAPVNLSSRMILGIPREQKRAIGDLPRVLNINDWWDRSP
jgi:hypothetical protein